MNFQMTTRPLQSSVVVSSYSTVKLKCRFWGKRGNRGFGKVKNDIHYFIYLKSTKLNSSYRNTHSKENWAN